MLKVKLLVNSRGHICIILDLIYILFYSVICNNAIFLTDRTLLILLLSSLDLRLCFTTVITFMKSSLDPLDASRG